MTATMTATRALYEEMEAVAYGPPVPEERGDGSRTTGYLSGVVYTKHVPLVDHDHHESEHYTPSVV